MQTAYRTSWLVVFAVIMPAAGFANASRGDQAADDSQAVRKVLEDQVAAWNRKDLDGFCSTYWNSPDLVFQSGGDQTKGFEAMRDRYRKRYQGDGKAMGTLTFKDLEVIVVANDAAMVRGRWSLVMPDKKNPNGLFTVILRKLPEGWRIVHDHTSAAS